jgi:hypothetical protein
MKASNLLLMCGVLGIGLAVSGYGYGVWYGIPNAAALLYGGFGAGFIVGIPVAKWFWKEDKPQIHTTTRNRDTGPARVEWFEDPYSNRVTQRQTLRSVNQDELRSVAVKVVNFGSHITHRGLSDVLSSEKISTLQTELVEKRLARWRVYKDGKPVPQQGIELEDRGKAVMYAAVGPTPYPAHGNKPKPRDLAYTHTQGTRFNDTF